MKELNKLIGFSRKFCELSASAWTKLGGYALVFEGPRSTPQLSFTVRHQYAHAGVVITASHNPSHDNGFKAYFADGAQLVPPHSEEVVKRYQAITISELLPLLSSSAEESSWNILPTEDDLAYRAALEDAVLDPEILKKHAPKLSRTEVRYAPILRKHLNSMGKSCLPADRCGELSELASRWACWPS